MAEIIHCKRTEKGLRYRVWSTVVDAYCHDEDGLTEADLRRWLLDRELEDWERETAERIKRANKTGTSALFPDREEGVTAPWETERCRDRAHFHVAGSPCPRGEE